MRKDRLMKVLVLLGVGLLSTGLYAANEVSEQGIPYDGMVITQVHVGEMVKKGQILYSVEMTPQIIVKNEDKNKLTYDTQTYKRDLYLLKKHIVSLATFQSAKNAYELAKASLASEILKIKHGTSKAPFDGEVTKILAYKGSAIGDSDDEVSVTKTDKYIAINKPVVAEVLDRWEHPIKMDVKLGQKVKKGQLLYSTSLGQLKITLEKDQSTLKLDDAVFARDKVLLKAKAIPMKTYQKARYDYVTALDAVKTDIQNNKDSFCYAPFDGTVTKIVSYTGATMGDGDDIVNVTKSPAPAAE